MPSSPHIDYYEVLQVSPRADSETIERVFRLLAKRYHPDNRESGNAERFSELVDAYRVLANAEERARYDATYQSTREQRWRLFDQDSTTNEVAQDARVRLAVLSLLY
ncbi:MAG TPA: DnaJ domain-containing protein, partial [Gemmatimonadaceae bacterium]|nr:DnaJ domain-containing protein [Gemmatimonadaceae bacterium]